MTTTDDKFFGATGVQPGRVTFIRKITSKETGKVAYLITFKLGTGDNAKSWVDSGFRNFPKWKEVIESWESGERPVVNGIHVKVSKGGLVVDADSQPIIVEREQVKKQDAPGQWGQKQ